MSICCEGSEFPENLFLIYHHNSNWIHPINIAAIMDILPNSNIFRELQDIHDTGYFSSQTSIEDQWQQASNNNKKTNAIT